MDIFLFSQAHVIQSEWKIMKFTETYCSEIYCLTASLICESRQESKSHTDTTLNFDDKKRVDTDLTLSLIAFHHSPRVGSLLCYTFCTCRPHDSLFLSVFIEQYHHHEETELSLHWERKRKKERGGMASVWLQHCSAHAVLAWLELDVRGVQVRLN